MRTHTDGLMSVLSGSFGRKVYVNIFHGADRVEEGLLLESWTLDSDLDGQVKTSGSGVIVYESVNGQSLIPEGTKGVLSPFRAQGELVMRISAGDFVEDVSLGLFRITSVPSARDYTADANGTKVVLGSRVSVRFTSLDEGIRRWGFRGPMTASSATCFDELRQITAMPVDENVDDQPLPSGLIWEPRAGARLDAVQKLARILGGVAVVDSTGSWTVVPDAGGDPVGVLRLGDKGTITDVGYEIFTDEVYNCVVGQFEDENRNEITAVKAVTSGDLDVDGPYGENTLYLSDDSVKTASAAAAAVAQALAVSTGAQQYDVPVQCHVNPVPEIGDVLEVEGWVRPLVGRLVKATISDSELMTVTLRVTRDL